MKEKKKKQPSTALSRTCTARRAVTCGRASGLRPRAMPPAAGLFLPLNGDEECRPACLRSAPAPAQQQTIRGSVTAAGGVGCATLTRTQAAQALAVCRVMPSCDVCCAGGLAGCGGQAGGAVRLHASAGWPGVFADLPAFTPIIGAPILSASSRSRPSVCFSPQNSSEEISKKVLTERFHSVILSSVAELIHSVMRGSRATTKEAAHDHLLHPRRTAPADTRYHRPQKTACKT